MRGDVTPTASGGNETEHTLIGGTANRGLVVRVGDTVRRPLRPASASTHALLVHLETVGFSGAPRLLGIDAQGREVLTFVEGEAVLPPYPLWGLTDESLVSVAHLLRDFHDATVDFSGDALTWSARLPEPFHTGGVISHNDPNLDNIVFREGRAVALIDFDLSAPGSRVWDVACAARLWAPLRSDADIDDARRGQSMSRFRRFVDAYGVAHEDRVKVVDAVATTHVWCYDVVTEGAERGNANFAEYWQAAGAARADRTQSWLEYQHQTMRAALG